MINTDIAREILIVSDVKTVCRASRTCKQWKMAADDNRVWDVLIRKDFPGFCTVPTEDHQNRRSKGQYLVFVCDSLRSLYIDFFQIIRMRSQRLKS